MQSLPLSAHPVVRQIVEHMVYTVAPEHHIVVGSAVDEQASIDIESRILMEIERGALFDGECSIFFDGDAPVDHDRFLYGECGIGRDVPVVDHDRIPCPCRKCHLLLHAAFEREDEVVGEHLRVVEIIDRRSQFDKDPNAVLVAYLDIGHLIALCRPKIRAVDIDAESRLIALCKPDTGAAYALARSVVHPECLGGRRYAREDRINLDGIGRERKEILRRRREVVIVGAS